jgi:hypothetical protein
MTATRARLAAELRRVAGQCKPQRAALYLALADRAATGEFDDFSDAHPCGPTALHHELRKMGADRFAVRVARGEFDATEAESEEWARSQTDPQIIALMDAMGIGPDRGKDQ